jgi:chorismate mutase
MNIYRVIAEALLDLVSGTASGRLQRQLIEKEAELANIRQTLEKIREEVAQTRGIIASLRAERTQLLGLVTEYKNDADELQKVVDEFEAMNAEFDEAILENPEDGEVVVDPENPDDIDGEPDDGGQGPDVLEPSANRPARGGRKSRKGK